MAPSLSIFQRPLFTQAFTITELGFFSGFKVDSLMAPFLNDSTMDPLRFTQPMNP